MVATVRAWTPERNAIGHTQVRFKQTRMFASSEHEWDPMASSSAESCSKTRTVPSTLFLVTNFIRSAFFSLRLSWSFDVATECMHGGTSKAVDTQRGMLPEHTHGRDSTPTTPWDPRARGFANRSLNPSTVHPVASPLVLLTRLLVPASVAWRHQCNARVHG